MPLAFLASPSLIWHQIGGGSLHNMTTDLRPKTAADPFLLQYSESELRIASEFLANWLPFLSIDLDPRCTRTLSDRVNSLSSVLFLWANASTFINKSPPRIPEVNLPQQAILDFSSAVSYELNRGLHLLHEIALGRELKKFLVVIAGLWLFSILGSSCNFLTLVYIIFVVLHTVPLLYEKHEDKVDSFAERAAVEVKKQYVVVNDKYLSKLPKVPLNKKAA